MKILFFSPAADLWAHSFPEALLAGLLKNSGSSVVQVRCSGILAPLCPAGMGAGFNSSTTKYEAQSLCNRCIQKRTLIDKKFKFKTILIDSYISKEDSAAIDELIKQAELLFKGGITSIENFSILSLDGIPIGASALYELILKYKINDIKLIEPIKDEYLLSLHMAGLVALASKKILAEVRPDCVSVYNSLYVPHRVFCLMAKKQMIPQYFIHAGTNLSRQHGTLMIGKDFTWAHLKNLVAKFHDFKNTPVKKFVIDDIAKHMMSLIKARNIFVYSVAKSSEYIDIRKKFGIADSQSILLACTSSYDERFAVEAVGASGAVKTLFKSTIEWVEYLISHAKNHPDRFVIIRVHPREYPNRRDSVKSIHSNELMKLMVALPENVVFNWPDEGISLYDLAQEASVILNAWSSVGKELALLGLPIVSYSKELLLYPSELNFIGETCDEYELAISKAIQCGCSKDLIVKAFRWYGLEFSRSLVDLRQSYILEGVLNGGKILRRCKNYLAQYVPFLKEKIDLFGVLPMSGTQKIICDIYSDQSTPLVLHLQQHKFDGCWMEEEEAIHSALKNIGNYLFAANPVDRPSKLQRFFQKNNFSG